MKFIPDDGSEEIPIVETNAEPIAQEVQPVSLPSSWIGPALSRPLDTYKNGKSYLDLVNSNLSGRRGMMEELTDAEAKDMPFVGAVSEVPYLFGVADTAKKLLNDEAVDEEKLIDLNQYLEFSKRKENATIGSKVLDIVQGSLSWGAEIAAMLALEGAGIALLPTGAGTAPGAGLVAAGAAIGAKTLATKTATKAAQLAISKLVNRTLGKAAAVASRKVMTSAIRGNATHQVLGQATQDAVLGTATKYMGKTAGTLAAKIVGTGVNLESRGLVGSLLSPNRVVQSYANRRLEDALNEGDETKEMAIAKSFLDVNFEIASEFSGEFLGKAAGRLFSPQMKKWMAQSAVLSHISKKAKTPNAQAAWGVLNAMGINGALEEMGEERVGGFLRGLFGVEGNAGLINAVRQSGWQDGEQFATEAIAFSVLPIMANGLNRVSGGQSFAERAKALDVVKKQALPDQQVYAMTPEQRRANAKDLKQRIDDEETFWFSDTPLKFLEHVFGKKRLSPTQSILSDLGVANMRVMHDVAQKKDPNNPEAGIQAIDDYLAKLQDLHTEGINSKKDVEDFNSGIKSGDIRVYQADKKYHRRYYLTKEGMTKPEVVELAKQTGISAITRISEQGERNTVADLTPDRFLIPWDDLGADEQKEWSLVEHTDDYGKLKELYEKRRASLPFSKTQNRLVLPTVLTGTADEMAAAGYPVKSGTPAFEKSSAGEDLYAIHTNATTNADGSEVDYATGGDVGDWTEDQIEAHYKQKKGLTLSPAVQKFIDDRRAELLAVENPSDSEKFQLSMLDPANQNGRFEYAIKAYYMNVMGYQHHADVGTRLIDFGKIDIPAEMDNEMRAIVGLPLLESLAFQKMPEVKRSPLNEELIRVMNMPGQVKGRADTARKIIDQASENAVVNRLKEALNKDLRLQANRDNVMKILNEETFSAETEKMQEMKAIRKAIKNDEWHVAARIAKTWITEPEEVTAKKLERRADRPTNIVQETRLEVLSEKSKKGATKKERADKKEYVRAKIVSERERLGKRVERLGRMIGIQRAMLTNVPDQIRESVFKIKPADIRRNITDLESKLNEVRQDQAMLDETPPRIRVVKQDLRNEPRDDTGSSIRDDRFDQEYDDFSPPVFSEAELRSVAPGWLVNADQIAKKLGLESPLDAWLEDPDGLDPRDLMRMVNSIRATQELSPFPDEEEKIDEIFYAQKKLLAESGIYKRQQAKITMPANRSRAGQSVPVAPTTAALPFDVQLPFEVNPDSYAGSSTLTDEEQDEFNKEIGIDKDTKPESEVEDEDPTKPQEMVGMTTSTPRNFTIMDLLDARSIREQLTVIVKYGQQSMSRAVEYIQHGFRNPIQEIDEIDIPRINHKQPEAMWRDPVEENYVYRDMINWVNHVETKLLKSWDAKSMPHLNKGLRSALQEDIDAEGAILVVDNGPRSLNQRLGSPIDRLFHALVHGMYPRGKVYADWYKTPVEGALNADGSARKYSPSKTYVATPNVNDDEVRGELEETMERKDFLTPSGYAVPPLARYDNARRELQARLEQTTPFSDEYNEIKEELAMHNRRSILLENAEDPRSVEVDSVEHELRSKVQDILDKWQLEPGDVRQSSTGKLLKDPLLYKNMKSARKNLVALAKEENMTLEGLLQTYRNMAKSEIPSLGESPQVYRGAVLPVTVEEIMATKGNEQARLDLEMKIHDFIVHNRIRRLILAGFDQVITTGQFEYIGKNGDKIIAPKQKVVPAEWEHQFSVVVKNAFSQETRDKALLRGDPAQIVYTPETVEAVRKNIEEQEGIQNRSFSASYEIPDARNIRMIGAVQDGNVILQRTSFGNDADDPILHGEMLGLEAINSDRFRVYESSIDPKKAIVSWTIFPGEKSKWLVHDELLSLGWTSIAHKLVYGKYGQTFSASMETNKNLETRILAGVKRFNNNRKLSDLEMKTYRGWIRKALNGEESGKAFLRRNLGLADQEAFKGLIGTPEAPTPVSGEIGLPTAPSGFSNQQEFDLRTHSAQAVTNIYQQISPIFASTGMHKAMLDILHDMNAIQFEQSKMIEKMKAGLGLLGDIKDLPKDHIERVNAVLSAVGAVLDNSSKIPIGWDANGNVTWDARSPASYGQSWDAYVTTHKLGMKTFAGLINEMREKYRKVREDYNEAVGNLSGEEWIKYLENYLPHIYQFRNDQHKEEFLASMREESKRALGRKFETYQQAAEEKGLVPKTMNALDLYDMYNQTVWSAAKNKALANMMAQVRDIDGAPLVVPVKLGGYGPKTHLLVDQNVLRETARNLADYLGDTFDPSKDPAEEIARMTAGINLEAHDFERLESPLTKSVDFFLVRRGVSSNLLKMVLNYGRMDNAFVNSIEHLNGWSKFMMLAASAFHPFALAESLAAVFGLSRKNPWFHLKKTHMDLNSIVKDMRENPTKYSHWIRMGLVIPTKSPDVDTGMISRDIEKGLTALEGSSSYASKVFIPGLKTLRWYKRKVDKWLWNELHPSMKLYSAEFVSSQWKIDHPTATLDEIEEMEKKTSNYLNKAFGGLDWATYTWATPRVMQWMHLGIFAPDWTFAAAEISALTRLPILNRMHTTTLSPLEKSEMLRRYWPSMIGLTLIAVPNFIQMLIYAAFGDPDREDVPFNFMNEMNRKTYIDFTPLFRHLPLYDGGPSGKRRIYMRWGKQAYEISEGWLEDPAMILRKSSSMVRQAFEQVTGQTVSGWDLPYKDQGLLGLVNVQGSFADSRIGSIAKNFLPITLQSVAKGEFAAFIAPGARGISQGGAVKAMSQVLEAYVYGNHLPEDQKPIDLHAIVADVISATRRNGLDPEIAFRQAKSSIAGKYYRKFFEAMNSNDESAMDEAAEKVLMLGSGIKQFEDSMTRRQEAIGKELTPEIAEAIKQSLIRVQDRS